MPKFIHTVIGTACEIEAILKHLWSAVAALKMSYYYIVMYIAALAWHHYTEDDCVFSVLSCAGIGFVLFEIECRRDRHEKTSG